MINNGIPMSRGIEDILNQNISVFYQDRLRFFDPTNPFLDYSIKDFVKKATGYDDEEIVNLTANQFLSFYKIFVEMLSMEIKRLFESKTKLQYSLGL